MLSCSCFSSSVITYSGAGSILELTGFFMDFCGDFDFSLPLSDHVCRFLASLFSYFLIFWPAPNASLVLMGFSLGAGGSPDKDGFSEAFTATSSSFPVYPLFAEAGATFSYLIAGYIGTPLSSLCYNFL